MLRLFADDDDQLAFVVNLFGGVCRNYHLFVMRDQRILRAIADLGPVGNVGHFAALVRRLLEMPEIIQPDAIEGARHQRQLDLDVGQRMRARRTLPFAEGFAADRDHAIAFDDTPG